MVDSIERWRNFVNLHKNSKQRHSMTISEACVKALNELGGRALLSDIYPRVMKLVEIKSATPDASIRAELQNHPMLFRRTPDKRGWWELVSFQEEIASRDRRIAELESENTNLKSVKTEDDFVKRLVKETKNLYKHEKDKIEVIRQILYKVGRSDAEEELDAWIEGRVYLPTVNVSGDLVVNKHVENEIGNVDAGGTGINNEIKKD